MAKLNIRFEVPADFDEAALSASLTRHGFPSKVRRNGKNSVLIKPFSAAQFDRDCAEAFARGYIASASEIKTLPYQQTRFNF